MLDASTFSDEDNHQTVFLLKRGWQSTKNEGSIISRSRCVGKLWMFQVLTNFYDVVSMMKSQLRHCGAIEERSSGKFGFRWNFRSLSDILQRFDANGNLFETLQRSRIKGGDFTEESYQGGRLYRGVVSRGVVGPPVITGRRPDFSIFFIHNVGKG